MMIARRTLVCICLLGAGPALAETLPMRPGAYVGLGTDCKDPPNVELRIYDGNGIGSTKANDCRSSVLSKRGNVFEIEQNCRQFGGPKVERDMERLTIRVDGPDRFTDMTGGNGESFRLCPGLKP